MSTQTLAEPVARPNRVPEVTAGFWAIKLMAVTMGETAADYLAVNLGYGLSTTSLVMAGLLVVALGLQFAQKRYVPWAYWLAVVMISIVGTLVTDNLTDTMGVPLSLSMVAFAAALPGAFALWYGSERTLSIHSIFTTRREAFYWLAILLTFALGTAAGDFVAEALNLGFVVTGLIFALVIALVAVCYALFDLNSVLAFWLAYIFTRPLGASLGDLLAQPHEYGGLGFGTIITSVLFLTVIGLIVLAMSFGRDVPIKPASRFRTML